jgi:osmotically-inducible protein OsmY
MGRSGVSRPATHIPMKNTLLFSMLAAGLVLTGCNKSTKTSTAANDPYATPTTTPTTTDTVGAKVDRATDRVADASRNAADNVRDASRRVGSEVREASHDAANAMRNAGHDLSARFSEWRLNNADLEDDARAGRDIVRTNTTTSPTGKVDKGTIEKAIKGRLNTDPMLADLKFDANCNAKGEVELEGKARSVDQIAHAMAVALDTEGVTQVKSKIKLDPDAGPNRR